MGVMNKFAIFILAIISILILVVLSMGLVLNSLLYHQTYYDTLEKEGVYNYLEENLAKSQEATFIEAPNGRYKEVVDDVVSNILAYIRSEKDTLEIKVKVDEDKLRDFFLDRISNFPECKQGQGPFSKNPCLPKGKTPEQFLDEFLENNNINVLEGNSFDITSVYGLEEGSEGRQVLDNLRDYVSYYKKSMIVVIIMLIAMISLIFILQGFRFKSSLKTISQIFLLSSLILFAIQYFLINLYSSIRLVIEIVANKVGFYAITLGGIAIILFVVSFMIKEEKSKQIKKPNKK